MAASEVGAASEEDSEEIEEGLEEIEADSEEDLAATEVGMVVEAGVASDTSQMALARLPKAHRLDLAAEEEAGLGPLDTVAVPTVAPVVLRMPRMVVGMVTGADDLTTTDPRTAGGATVGQVAATASPSEAATEIAIAKVGMVTATTTRESGLSTATATKIPEANEDIEASPRRTGFVAMGVLRLFYFPVISPSLSSSRVSGRRCSPSQPYLRLDCRLSITPELSAEMRKHAAYVLAQLPAGILYGRQSQQRRHQLRNMAHGFTFESSWGTTGLGNLIAIRLCFTTALLFMGGRFAPELRVLACLLNFR